MKITLWGLERSLGLVIPIWESWWVVFYDIGVDMITKRSHGKLEKKVQDEVLRDPSI